MNAIKQAIEALEKLLSLDVFSDPDVALSTDELDAVEEATAALDALRSMPAEPYAYAVYFPDQPTEELVHVLDELLDDMTNREHTITPVFTTPHTAPVLTEAERLSDDEKWIKAEVLRRAGGGV